MQYQLEHGDCLEVLRTLADSSVDAIVTDPPYGLSFMGKRWDYDVPGVEVWTECLRVLKPGGHLLAFAGTRTQHRMAVRIEDAGFEIRDMIAWVYGSGFPKSLDVSKAIDKTRRRDYVLAAVELGLSIPGNNLHDWTKADHSPGDKWWNEFKLVLTPDQWGAIERVVVGTQRRASTGRMEQGSGGYAFGEDFVVTAPATEAAAQWDGWGTALKPALEPITVARKPLAGTVAANVLEHGTGALNIDGCRVETADNLNGGDYAAQGGRSESQSLHGGTGMNVAGKTVGKDFEQPSGRWPANLIHDGSDDVLAAFPNAPGQQARVTGSEPTANGFSGAVAFSGMINRIASGAPRPDAGSAARFFYCAKAGRSDRNAGLTSGSAPAVGAGATMREREDADWPARNGNHHPTVKPTDLMAYLCRLVTPPGGLVLDPFMGSGSTGKACMREGFRFLGIEREAEYLAIARARIEHEARRHGELTAEPLPPETIAAAAAPPEHHAPRPEPEPAQRGLF